MSNEASHVAWIGLAVFLSVGIADVAWAKYMLAMKDGKKLKAALWSAGIVALSSITIVAYISSRVYIVPAVLGAFFGTIIGML